MKERRSDLRLNPTTLKADIHSSLLSDTKTSIHAEIVDISRTGIRIKLKEPCQGWPKGVIKISMYLPDSKASFSVNCLIKNQRLDTEYGLHFIQDEKVKGSIDDLIFECVEIEESLFEIKSSSFSSLSFKTKVA